MILIHAVLATFLSSPALPAAAAPAAAVTASTAPAGSVPPADMQPDPESKSFGYRDFEETVKDDLKQVDVDLKEAIGEINAQHDAEAELESRLQEKKAAFRRGLRDSRVAFEKTAMEGWRALLKRMSAMAPEERGPAKISFDQKANAERGKFNDDLSAKSRVFMEEQNDEVQRFWGKRQKSELEARRGRREHETKWGNPAAER